MTNEAAPIICAHLCHLWIKLFARAARGKPSCTRDTSIVRVFLDQRLLCPLAAWRLSSVSAGIVFVIMCHHALSAQESR